MMHPMYVLLPTSALARILWCGKTTLELIKIEAEFIRHIPWVYGANILFMCKTTYFAFFLNRKTNFAQNKFLIISWSSTCIHKFSLYFTKIEKLYRWCRKYIWEVKVSCSHLNIQHSKNIYIKYIKIHFPQCLSAS